ncbi:MAG TPA: VanZ family protein, partial [Polyangiaceae bacterium]|nr:VanZ family protein [Polyangiaceae bacterium]
MTQNDARPSRALTSIDVVVAALYAAAIFVVGSLPGAVAIAKNVSDKLQHALGFALLAWLWCRALRRLRPGWALPRVSAASAALSVALGGALELWQGLLAYRSCDVLDWLADAVGAAI